MYFETEPVAFDDKKLGMLRIDNLAKCIINGGSV